MSMSYKGESGEVETGGFGVYEGERNSRGERHGFGKAFLPNGDVYVGRYCDGLRHGKGLYVFKNGAKYDGEWRRGLKYGNGTFFYPDGTRYHGEWKKDFKYGFGIYYYENGNHYEGSWKRDLRHGLGTYLWSDSGVKFMGTWIKDRMQGPGQLVFPTYRFHGSWDRNLGEDVNEDELVPLQKGISSFWRVRHITPYDPDLLPPEAVPLQEARSIESLVDECGDERYTPDGEQYLSPGEPNREYGESTPIYYDFSGDG